MALKKVYFDALDKWRFFAAFIVICAHYVTFFSVPQNAFGKYLGILLTLDNSGAEAGVRFFFVLSGFLITYFLIFEKENVGKNSISKFYMRRVLRIWPLYMVSVAIGFILVPMLLGHEYKEMASWQWYVSFLANFDQIYNWNATSFSNPLLGVHWSVSVEEQFYLLWPLVFFIPLRYFLWLSLFLILSSSLFQSITHLPTHTFSSFHDLTIGGVTAYYGFYRKEQIETWLKSLGKFRIMIIYLIGFAFLLARYQLNIHFSFYHNLSRTIDALFFAFVLLEQCFNHEPLFSWLSSSVVSYLGRISYGLYLLHPVSMLLIKTYLPVQFRQFGIQFSISVLFSILLSMASYHLFEIYFLKLKKRV